MSTQKEKISYFSAVIFSRNIQVLENYVDKYNIQMRQIKILSPTETNPYGVFIIPDKNNDKIIIEPLGQIKLEDIESLIQRRAS